MNFKLVLYLFVVLQVVQGGLQILQITPGDCAAVTCSTEIQDPQCCDGEFFPNSCLARCGANDFSTCQPGSCNVGEFQPQLPVDGPLNCAVVLCAAGFTDPVCCNGTSIGNSCQAQCVEGISDVASQCTKGFCAGDEIFCTEEFEPVCCGTESFDNLCKARLDLGDIVDTICTEGECQIICPTIFDPICCFGNEEFSNTCEASISYGDLPDFEDVCVKGFCSGQIGCTQQYDPVCCNGETFSNQCFADVELGAYQAYEECIPGECPLTGGAPVFCTLDFTPVCCEGQTYSNQCAAGVILGEEIAFEVCIDGECDDDIFAPSPIDQMKTELTPVMENLDMGN